MRRPSAERSRRRPSTRRHARRRKSPECRAPPRSLSIASTSHGLPKTWTATIAAPSPAVASAAGSMLKLAGSISTKRGSRPSQASDDVVATKLNGVVEDAALQTQRAICDLQCKRAIRHEQQMIDPKIGLEPVGQLIVQRAEICQPCAIVHPLQIAHVPPEIGQNRLIDRIHVHRPDRGDIGRSRSCSVPRRAAAARRGRASPQGRRSPRGRRP